MQLVQAALLLMSLSLQPRELVRIDWSRFARVDPEIVALRGEYAAAVNARDAERTAALYTADALVVLCDGSLARGPATIAGRIANRTDAHASVTLMPRRFTAAANIASETGTFIESIAGANGTTSVEGVYVTIYSRLPGQAWRIALEVRTTGHAPALAVW